MCRKNSCCHDNYHHSNTCCQPIIYHVHCDCGKHCKGHHSKNKHHGHKRHSHNQESHHYKHKKSECCSDDIPEIKAKVADLLEELNSLQSRLDQLE